MQSGWWKTSSAYDFQRVGIADENNSLSRHCISKMINLGGTERVCLYHQTTSFYHKEKVGRQTNLLKNEMSRDVSKHAGFGHVLSNVVSRSLSNHCRPTRSRRPR